MAPLRMIEKIASDIERRNQQSRLVKLPKELQLRVFALLLGNEDKILPANKVFNHPLGRYGGICRALRSIAVTAYYENNTLVLTMTGAPEFGLSRRRQNRPNIAKDTIIRFGTIYSTDDDDAIEAQYTIELPPRYVRTLIRHIRVELTIPDGYEHEYSDPARRSEKVRAKTTPYHDEYNDWLVPIYKIHTEYGFHTATKVVVAFEVFRREFWTRDGVEGLKAWVLGLLLAEMGMEERIMAGMLKLEFPEL